MWDNPSETPCSAPRESAKQLVTAGNAHTHPQFTSGEIKMPTAYNGRILHVDLGEGRWWQEEVSDALYRRYLGGSALASYFMLRDIPAHANPLGPENKLIFMTSVTNGLPLSGCNRYTAAGKSPLTGGFGEAEAGGYWGPELKRTGFDGIIIHGQAEKPVYLYVHDGECEIRDAGAYWGKLSGEVQDGLLEEIGDSVSVRRFLTRLPGSWGGSEVNSARSIVLLESRSIATACRRSVIDRAR